MMLKTTKRCGMRQNGITSIAIGGRKPSHGNDVDYDRENSNVVPESGPRKTKSGTQ